MTKDYTTRFYYWKYDNDDAKKELLDEMIVDHIDFGVMKSDILCMIFIQESEYKDFYLVRNFKDAFYTFFDLKRRSIINRMTPAMIKGDLEKAKRHIEKGSLYQETKSGMKAYIEYLQKFLSVKIHVMEPEVTELQMTDFKVYAYRLYLDPSFKEKGASVKDMEFFKEVTYYEV